MKLLVPLVVLAACAAQAQMLKIPPSFDKLADKAEEVADVTLDANMLGMASKFLSDKDPDDKAAKKVVAVSKACSCAATSSRTRANTPTPTSNCCGSNCAAPAGPA